jgi:hypothetical protein
MMLHGASGPFTKDQARAGFELAQTGQVLAGRLKIDERVKLREENRVDAQRNGTHSTRTVSASQRPFAIQRVCEA